ncbi:MAG: YiiX/YebB-like N1pC/P60 family cysteine hydrolase [Bacteriovoracaceae bacterium]
MIYAFLVLASFIQLSFAEVKLKNGDILLQPLNCSACDLIEAEESTIFSHVGVVIQTRPDVLVAEAYGNVRATRLEDFLKKSQKGQRVLIARLKNLKAVDSIQNDSFTNFFFKNFNNLKYDDEFLWNNVDDQGREKLYCSELVSKLYFESLRIEIPVKRMHFFKNRQMWFKYFNGKIPDGEWGNSPGDIERSSLFYHLGEL